MTKFRTLTYLTTRVNHVNLTQYTERGKNDLGTYYLYLRRAIYHHTFTSTVAGLVVISMFTNKQLFFAGNTVQSDVMTIDDRKIHQSDHCHNHHQHHLR